MKLNKKNEIFDKDINGYSNKSKIKPTVKIVLCCIFAFMLIIVSFYLFKLGNNVVSSETDKIDYVLSGKVDYKVHLKKNDYYKEEYLKSGMQYIASLIDSIDIDFKYEAHSSEKLNYKYKYNVSATTLVTSKSTKSKIIFENKEYILKDEIAEVNNNNFVIKKEIPIDYNKYNDYILDYKREYLLNTLFDLIINIHVETTGESKISKIPFNESQDFELIIPLSEQIIDISKKSSNYEKSGTIYGTENKTIKAKVLYGTGIISAIISAALLIRGLVIIIIKNSEKSEYHKTIDKYLREYDRAIVMTHKTKLDEHNFERVIEITSIEEMIDLHDNFQLPILYYETEKNQKSYFVVINENILYKLVVSKEKLEKNSGDN